jgi:hypothetical protein
MAARSLRPHFVGKMRERTAHCSERARDDGSSHACPPFGNRSVSRGAGWTGVIICATRRLSIGNLQKRPKIHSSSKSFSIWQSFVRR